MTAKDWRKKGRPEKWWNQAWENVCADLEAAEKDNKELRALFALQHTRMGEATKRWQEVTGRHDTLPDLGDLLGWLLNRADFATLRAEKDEARVKELEAEVAFSRVQVIKYAALAEEEEVSK